MKFLQFAPDRVLVEQFRLIHTNALPSMLAGSGLSVLIVVALLPSRELFYLLIWSAFSWLSTLIAWLLARQFSRSPNKMAHVRSATTTAVAFYTVSGGLYGGLLPWIALDQAAPLSVALVIAASAGVIAGALPFMSPVLPVFMGHTLAFTTPLAIKLFTFDELIYKALGLATVFFVAALCAQAYKSSLAFRQMIETRFANEALVEQLREESQRAIAARAEAESANLAKLKFLAAASHDLRQPIHAQGLFLALLARTDLSVLQREVLDHARAASTASGDMLNTLLDFSRIEAGVVTPVTRAFRLQPLLNHIEIELAPQADAKGIVYRCPETWAVVDSDPALVELILRNLVSNAIRYTTQGGVLVAVRKRAERVLVQVYDTGMGIAPEHHETIFQEFHQLGNPERDRHKGLGLGLAIARGLAHGLDLALRLNSRLGRGSMFELTLPLSHATVVSEPDADAPMRLDHASLLNVRIMVIDDDKAVCIAMQHLLCEWGADCLVAESIEEALLLARTHPPALVISDYRLREERTGTEAIAAMRAQHGAALPALLVTGDTAPQRLRDAQASGVPLLHKPVTPDVLLQKIMMVLHPA